MKYVHIRHSGGIAAALAHVRDYEEPDRIPPAFFGFILAVIYL